MGSFRYFQKFLDSETSIRNEGGGITRGKFGQFFLLTVPKIRRRHLLLFLSTWARYRLYLKALKYYASEKVGEKRRQFVVIIKKNIGTEVLTARLPKILNILTTSVTTCSCNAIEHVAKSGEIRQRTSMIYQRRFMPTILT